MKHFKFLSLLLFICLLTTSCSNEQTGKQEILTQELEIAKQELRNKLDSKENPITSIINSYAKSSKITEVDLQSDLELSYKRMTERLKLVANGELESEEYFKDVNGAFEKNSGFRSELGKLISSYYKEDHIKKNKDRVNNPAFESYKKVQELKTRQ